jgi:aromatic-L-amino-acid/L-tryptophan decarboxylase
MKLLDVFKERANIYRARMAFAGVAYRANRGPELSRALRGLPFWISMKTHGATKFGQMVDKNMAQSRFLEGLVKDSPNLEFLVSGPLPIVNFRYRGPHRLSEKALNRLNESLVSEIQKRGIAIPSLYAIGGKSCVRVCNLNQRSQRSDFEALVQACEQLGVELEARTGHKADQHVKIRRVAARRYDGGRTGARMRKSSSKGVP